MTNQSNISSNLLFFSRYPFLLHSVPLHSVLFSSRLCLPFSEDPVLDELKDFGGLWNYSVWISMMSWTWSGLSWKRKTMEAKFTHSSWFITADNCGPVTDKMFISFTPHYKVPLPSFLYLSSLDESDHMQPALENRNYVPPLQQRPVYRSHLEFLSLEDVPFKKHIWYLFI